MSTEAEALRDLKADEVAAAPQADAETAGALKPRDAASLIIVDHSFGEPRVLMGRRSDAQVFLPGKFVFPGGRVEPADVRLKPPRDLPEPEFLKLLVDMKGKPSAARARALALAAIRETYEETGFMVGHAEAAPLATRSAAWAGFFGHGLAPDLSVLTYLARAITPPNRPRRYDTRFFCVSAHHVLGRVEALDRELTQIGWFSLEEAKGLDVLAVTRVILEDLAERLGPDGEPVTGMPVPYYYTRGGSFRRELIA